MKRLSLTALTVLVIPILLTACSWAAGPPAGSGPLGIGLELGSPTGATFRYWMDSKNTIQGGLGWIGGDLTATADFVRSDFSALSSQTNPQLNGQLAFNYGVGARVRADSEDSFGVRGILGVSYFFPRNPFELFAEIVPVFIFDDGGEGELDGDVGFRYYIR